MILSKSGDKYTFTDLRIPQENEPAMNYLDVNRQNWLYFDKNNQAKKLISSSSSDDELCEDVNALSTSNQTKNNIKNYIHTIQSQLYSMMIPSIHLKDIIKNQSHIIITFTDEKIMFYDCGVTLANYDFTEELNNMGNDDAAKFTLDEVRRQISDAIKIIDLKDSISNDNTATITPEMLQKKIEVNIIEASRDDVVVIGGKFVSHLTNTEVDCMKGFKDGTKALDDLPTKLQQLIRLNQMERDLNEVKEMINDNTIDETNLNKLNEIYKSKINIQSEKLDYLIKQENQTQLVKNCIEVTKSAFSKIESQKDVTPYILSEDQTLKAIDPEPIDLSLFKQIAPMSLASELSINDQYISANGYFVTNNLNAHRILDQLVKNPYGHRDYLIEQNPFTESKDKGIFDMVRSFIFAIIRYFNGQKYHQQQVTITKQGSPGFYGDPEASNIIDLGRSNVFLNNIPFSPKAGWENDNVDSGLHNKMLREELTAKGCNQLLKVIDGDYKSLQAFENLCKPLTYDTNNIDEREIVSIKYTNIKDDGTIEFKYHSFVFSPIEDDAVRQKIRKMKAYIPLIYQESSDTDEFEDRAVNFVQTILKYDHIPSSIMCTETTASVQVKNGELEHKYTVDGPDKAFSQRIADNFNLAFTHMTFGDQLAQSKLDVDTIIDSDFYTPIQKLSVLLHAIINSEGDVDALVKKGIKIKGSTGYYKRLLNYMAQYKQSVNENIEVDTESIKRHINALNLPDELKRVIPDDLLTQTIYAPTTTSLSHFTFQENIGQQTENNQMHHIFVKNNSRYESASEDKQNDTLDALKKININGLLDKILSDNKNAKYRNYIVLVENNTVTIRACDIITQNPEKNSIENELKNKDGFHKYLKSIEKVMKEGDTLEYATLKMQYNNSTENFDCNLTRQIKTSGDSTDNFKLENHRSHIKVDLFKSLYQYLVGHDDKPDKSEMSLHPKDPSNCD